MISPNTVVASRYRVVRLLGGGAMKQVYLAEDQRLANRACALAEMLDAFANPLTQQQAVASFQREADILATLDNDHIVRVYDRFSEANRHFLVMQYVPGTTLEERVRATGGRLGENEAIDIAIQILDALEYMHSRIPPVIYRDLKPSNVMLTPDGAVKLIDFGVARHFQPKLTATMIGTQGYAPPEQYAGKIEARSDLYALGATMHQLLTGRDPSASPPFSFPPVRQLNTACSVDLAGLVETALKYQLNDRLPSAAEFKRQLSWVKGQQRSAQSSAPAVLSPAAVITHDEWSAPTMSAATAIPSTGDHAEPNYIAIFVYLSVLTAAELAVYSWFPGAVKIAMLVALAWAKAALVAMYFMHLRFERRTLAVIAFIPVVLVTFLSFMLMPDLTSRLWAHNDAHQEVTAPSGESAPPPAPPQS